MMGEKRGFLFSGKPRLIEDIIDIYRFTIPLEDEQAVMSYLVHEAMLDQEGRGSIYSERTELLFHEERVPLGRPFFAQEPPVRTMIQHLAGITVIVQRGQGDTIARAALEMGVCIPSVTFGIGAGLRDKLGLIRITIPAEKEIVNIISPQHDVQGVLVRLIEAGKLDQPGKGFIFTYPVLRGVLNTRLYSGRHLSAATLGQIVTALDELKGSTAWRRKFTSTTDHKHSRKRSYLRDLEDLSIFCTEGRATELAQVAMDAGASGATVRRLRRAGVGDAGQGKESPAREHLTMVLPSSQVEIVASALIAAGLFDERTYGEMMVRPVPEAYTYLAGTTRK